eukprot:COSAG05_NODE_2092_length_3575_cov_3.065305_3_plen_148_part_00
MSYMDPDLQFTEAVQHGEGFGHWLGSHWKEVGAGLGAAALAAGMLIPGVDVAEAGALAGEAAEGEEAATGANTAAKAASRSALKSGLKKYGGYATMILGPQALQEDAPPPKAPPPPEQPENDLGAISDALAGQRESDGPQSIMNPYR